ncbi:MAG: 50S ribosomal protein L30e [Candidatus Poseidoniales archaeon]|nr:50S ribosomal protein L30e [Euryarchaeota archaeon]MAM36329.1 50S ribosomal protein L30e [Euryarchaeota archaeon]RJU93933.1 MAG: 50S ribosomal protein L30e [Candidatus Poseidoniales archaeon]|tara:strand:+ start:228 stop:527 length:300 start_codon:yes stop_codon:yes gene_type:complete
MDLSRQLKNAIATGNLRFGQRQAIDACARGEAKVVILAANCPTDFTDELHANHPEVTKFRSGMVNRELGIACGKPFAVSTISIIDAGDSELLQLETNLE